MLYQLEGYQTLNTDRGYDAEYESDTLKEAKKRARYMLSEDYRKACEASERLTLVRIMCRGQIVHEEMR